jgi:ABC-2 type transport system ATP-binding protein
LRKILTADLSQNRFQVELLSGLRHNHGVAAPVSLARKGGQTMLELRRITKKYNHIPVVNDVSFDIQPGEILGYLGPNGAGKSTTVKLMCGLVEKTSGQIFFNGRDVDADLCRFKARVGYVPEQASLYPHLSGREYMQLVGRLRGISEAVLDCMIEGLMTELGLEIDMYLPIANYSKGMLQKVLIASALLHDPDILLLDEPLSGLDVSTMMVVKKVLFELAEAGKIILYSSHVLDVVERICTRVVILNRGRVVADDSVGNLRALRSSPSLESVFRELVEEENVEQKAGHIVSLSLTGSGRKRCQA